MLGKLTKNYVIMSFFNIIVNVSWFVDSAILQIPGNPTGWQARVVCPHTHCLQKGSRVALLPTEPLVVQCMQWSADLQSGCFFKLEYRHESKGCKQTKSHQEGRVCCWCDASTLEAVVSDRLLVIKDNDSQPLHNTQDNLKSIFNNKTPLTLLSEGMTHEGFPSCWY